MPRGPIAIEVATDVAATRTEVWAAVSTFAGVNAELMPLCKMVEPRSLRGRTLASYQPGERAPCWLLAGGVVPFDRHLLGLASVVDGEGFVEESTSWLQRRWRHERTLTSIAGGCRVADRLTIVPRLPMAAPLTRAAVTALFGHRHRRLARRFGVVGGSGGARR